MINKIYSWNYSLWLQLIKQVGKLPHALLLSGPTGIGKLELAHALSQFLLCSNRHNTLQACGTCSSCHWFEANTHPDFKELTLEQDASEDIENQSKKKGKKTQISVGQIRELGDFLSLSSHQSQGLKIALIQPADALSHASANALLKMLEEPPRDVIFILVTHQIHRLLPTIRSRCHRLNMLLPKNEDAVLWLETQGIKSAQHKLHYYGGAPLLVLRDEALGNELQNIWHQLALGAKMNIFSLASDFLNFSSEIALSVLQKWIYDLLASKLLNEIRYHADLAATLAHLARLADEKKLLSLQIDCTSAKMSASHPLNWELQLEGLLLKYIQLFESK